MTRFLSTTGVARAKVSDSNVLNIWKRIDGDNIKTVRVEKPKYKLGQHVKISKKRMRFAKGAEQNYSRDFPNFKSNKQTTTPSMNCTI
jgi:hypothetical protein